MDLVLVAIHIEASPRAVPLGPAMLASALKRAFPEAIRTRVLDLFLQQSAEACALRILAERPQAVGFSMYVWNRTRALEIAGILKRSDPGLIIFAGGSEATADFQGVLLDPAMDFVLPGEGEEIIVAAMGRLLQGAAPRDLQDTIEPAPILDLATLASPFLDGTLDLAAYSGQLWELSRGCPFTCDFCFESRGGSGTRRVPMARVEAELRLFEQSLVSQVLVLDPTFNYDRKQAKEVLRLIRRTAPGIHFFFEIRSEFLDRELAGLFAGIKCTLQIGLQSARPEVLKQIGRTLDPADFQRKILLLHQAGATYGFDLIYGLPGDDLEGFQASLDFALGLMPNHLDIFRLSVLPGTRLRETAEGLGLVHQRNNPYQVLSSSTFSGPDLDRAERLARSCDLFYNQGKAVPWFAILLAALDITRRNASPGSPTTWRPTPGWRPGWTSPACNSALSLRRSATTRTGPWPRSPRTSPRSSAVPQPWWRPPSRPPRSRSPACSGCTLIPASSPSTTTPRPCWNSWPPASPNWRTSPSCCRRSPARPCST